MFIWSINIPYYSNFKKGRARTWNLTSAAMISILVNTYSEQKKDSLPTYERFQSCKYDWIGKFPIKNYKSVFPTENRKVICLAAPNQFSFQNCSLCQNVSLFLQHYQLFFPRETLKFCLLSQSLKDYHALGWADASCGRWRIENDFQ